MRLGGGRPPHFSEVFFSQLDQEILIVDDYGYAGIDFRNDLDLVLSMGYDWDAALGKKNMLDFFLSSYVFMIFVFFYFFFWYLT